MLPVGAIHELSRLSSSMAQAADALLLVISRMNERASHELSRVVFTEAAVRRRCRTLQGLLAAMFYRIMQLLIILVSKVYFRLTSDGHEQIPKTGGVLLVANHCSFLDPPLIGCQVQRVVHYMTKEELLRIPVLGWTLRHLNTIPIRREGIDRKALERAVEVLKRGEVLLVFPEGTRSHDGKIQSPRRGAGMIAAACENITIVPAYIRGSFEAMPPVARFPKPHKVHVSFGEPFHIRHGDDAASHKERYQQISVLIMDKIRALQEHPSAESCVH